MKNFILLCFFAVLRLSVSATNNYHINEVSLDGQFENAENITEKLKQEFSDLNKLLSDTDYVRTSTGMNKHTKAAIAGSAALALTFCGAVGGAVIFFPAILCIATFIPVHRFILGTGDGGTKIFFAYFCTASGCSVGLLADVIFLWMNSKQNNYENCNKVLMWN